MVSGSTDEPPPMHVELLTPKMARNSFGQMHPVEDELFFANGADRKSGYHDGYFQRWRDLFNVMNFVLTRKYFPS
jgi:hypothetical protein